MAFAGLKWFSRKKDVEEESRNEVLDEFQGIKKLLRKQTLLIEDALRERETAAAREKKRLQPMIELCDSVFHLGRAFRSPGIMSRQHAQVLNMVTSRMERFAASLGVEVIQGEGAPFDSRLHEAVANQSPGSETLEVMEVIQPGYLHNGTLIRPAKVIVGNACETTPARKGTIEA